MNRTSLLCTSILLLGCCRLFAQQQGMEWLTTRQGLSQGFVSCMLQDREGFIWAGTKNGLNRYDGYQFEVFTHDPFDEYSLSSDFIGSIVEYGDFLIIYTNNSGINLFHKQTRQVYRITNDLITKDFPAEDVNAFSAFADAAGCLWVVLTAPPHLSNLFKITLPAGFWQDPKACPDFQKQLKVQTWPDRVLCNPVISKDLKTIYAVTDQHSFFQIDTPSDRWNKLAATTPPSLGFEQLALDPTGELWFSHRATSGTIELYRFRPGDARGLARVEVSPDFVNVLFVDHKYVWINQFNSLGLYRLNASRQFDPNRPEIPAIPVTPGQYCSLIDQSGLSWIGTNGLGIMKINVQSRRFRHLFPGKSVYSNIFMDRQGDVFATANTLEYLFSPGPANHPSPPFWNALKGLHPEPRILQDHTGVYWVAGVYINGRNVMLKKVAPDGRISTFSVTPSIEYYNQFAIAFDEQEHIWLGQDEQLIHFNPATERFDVFDYRQKLKEAKGVMALAKTADGSWWIGRDNGLVQAKPAANGFEFHVFQCNPKNRNSLRSNIISSLLTDPTDPAILWIGTKGGGLNRLDTRNLQFTHLTTREGLPDNVIYGILSDDEHRLWMSSNKGLFCYNPANWIIKNYTKEDGIQDNEFNTWAYGKSFDGTLLFGGVNGLTVFQPRELLEDTLPPNTKITGLRINDRAIRWEEHSDILNQSIEFTNEITLPFSRNNLTLEFVALHFTSPDKNRFRYYLEGAEREWEHESSNHSASYLNLAPGTYVFRVKGANSEGVWSKEPAILKITILPPWYRSWLAWIAYALIVGGGAYTFYRYQLRTKLEHAENQRLKELDNFKSRFFTNITHEFRTPLTVILGMTEQVKKYFSTRAEQEHHRSVELIRRNGQNLLNLINQILDLAKLESGKLQLSLEQTDVVAFAKYMVEAFHSFAASHHIQLHFLTEMERLEMDLDREKMQMVLSNLLSNAIKFTPENSHVYVQLSQIMVDGLPFCQIKVRDTGIGIPEDKIGQVFDRFYQADNSTTRPAEGTGIGLTLTKELLLLMGGQISVTSNKAAGTTFVVTIPVTTRSQVTAGANPVMPILPPPIKKTPLPAAPVENPEKPLLLVVEDNDDVRDYLIECVSEQYQIATAHNGRAGIEKALELIPDLIVSDVMMPEKDGFELCQVLKNDERTSHIPLVLLTAKADVGSRIEGLSRGADDYIAKPFDPAELTVRLRNLIENRRRLQARYASLPLPPVSEDPDLQLEDAFLRKIRDVVEAHLSDADFEMPQLERALGMSRSQIFRKVKALTNQSPSLFIRSIRLFKAKELLQTSNLTIAEVAYEVGFTTPSYFSTAFLEEFGKNPSDFR